MNIKSSLISTWKKSIESSPASGWKINAQACPHPSPVLPCRGSSPTSASEPTAESSMKMSS
eukprot:1161311-Pelagomonas_calceolata.AAC.4